MEQTVFLRRSDGALAQFTGMSAAAIITMLAAQGMTAQILTEQEYQAALPQF